MAVLRAKREELPFEPSMKADTPSGMRSIDELSLLAVLRAKREELPLKPSMKADTPSGMRSINKLP